MKPKLVIIGLMLLLMVTMVSASKTYNEETKTYEMKDWLFFKKYEISLSAYDDHLVNAWAEGELVVHKESKVFKHMFYKTLSGSEEEFNSNRNEGYKFYVNNTYERFKYEPEYDCVDIPTDQGNGTITYEQNCTEVLGEWVSQGFKTDWIPFDLNEKIPVGSYKWRADIRKPSNRKIDFIIETDDEGNLTEWAWLNTTYLYRKKINLNSTVDTSLADFPALFVLNTTELIDEGKMQADCDDIIISNSNGTIEFPYEVEDNTCNTGYTNIYFKVDNLSAQSTITEAYVYYGSASATNGENVSGVWLNGYTHVSHMTGLSDELGGVTWENNNGVDFILIDNKRVANFTSGNSEYLNISGSSNYLWTTNTVVTLIIKPYKSGAGIFGTAEPLTGSTGWCFEGGAGTNFPTEWGMTTQQELWASDNLDINTVKAFHFKKENTNATLFDNGDLKETDSWIISDLNGRVLGRRTGSGPYFDGYIDELRWSSVIRSDDWIRAEISQSYTLDAEEPLNQPPVTTLISPANDTTYNTNGILQTFTCKGADETQLDNITFYIWNQSTGAVLTTILNSSVLNNTNTQFDYTLTGGTNYSWNCLSVDDLSASAFATNNWTVNVIAIPDEAPIVDLNSPANNTQYLTSPQSIDFNCTASDDINLSNVSLIVGGSINLTNSSGINNTDYIFTPSSFNDGTYTWSCRGVDNESQTTQPTARMFTVDGNNPVVNITAPPNGTIITQFNQAITLNWTAEDPNLDSCFYGYDVYALKFDDNYNLSTTSGLLFDGWIYVNFTGASPDYETILDVTFPSKVEIYIQKTPLVRNVSSNIQTISSSGNEEAEGFPFSGWRYYVVNITGTGTLDVFRSTNYVTTDYAINETKVNCEDNTTTFNYPPQNPSDLSIAFFANDSVGNIASDNVTVVKSTTAPQINITSPIASYDKVLNNTGLDLNVTVTNTTVLDTCLYEYNGANNSVTCSTSISENLTYINGVNTVNVCINDTLGNTNCTAKTWIVKVIETGVDFDSPVFEGSTQQFTFNITTDSTVAVAEAHLIYGDSVNDTSTLRVSGNDYQLVNSIEIPDVVAEENITFYWEIVLSDTSVVNTTSNNQTVQPINIDDCSNYTVVLYNLTMYDEQTKVFVTPPTTSIEVDLEIFSTSGTTAFLSFNQTFNNTNPAQICLDQNLTADGYLGNLQVRYGATDKVTELYNIDKDPLNNGTIPNNVGLYPLNSSSSTSFQIIYKGSEFLPIEGAVLQIKRKYIGEGSFTVVEAPKTDAEGKAVAHFEVENVVYTIVVVKDGVILDSFNNIVLRCSNPLTEECELKLDSFRSSTDFSDWDTLGDITYTTAFDEDARTVTAQFNTVSGSARTVRLLGTKFDGVGNVTICDESLFSSAGTLTCTVDSSYGNFTMITELFSQGETVTTAVVSFEDNIIDVLGNDTFFFVFFIILIIPLLFITSTVGMVIAGIVGILFSMVILFVEATTIFSKGAALTWLIIAGLIIIWKITKRENI